MEAIIKSDGAAYDVIIIGGGLAGLSCAVNLFERGYKPLILEASDGIGGRIRTDDLDGYKLDRGFQVFLTRYPEAARILDYKKLNLANFKAGAIVRAKGRFIKVSDPFREPQAFVSMLVSDIAPMHDKVKIAYLRQSLINCPLQEIFRKSEKTIQQALEDYGFSSLMINRFFRPFFGGITLDPSLGTSSRIFDFIYKMMAEGNVAVPALGMGSLTAQLASRLPPECIRLSTKVESIDKDKNFVTLADGKGSQIEARAIVVAAEGPEAARLLGLPDPGSRQAICMYFACDKDKAPTDEPMLILNGQLEDGGPINNLAVMSNVSSHYAPKDKALISVTVLEHQGRSDTDLLQAVIEQLQDWYGKQVSSDWHHLRTYRIHHAQPDQSPGSLEPPSRPVGIAHQLYVCGDHRETASINGAIASGRKAALAAIQDLKIPHS